MAKNGKDTNHTRHIYRRVYFVRNGENGKIQKIFWYEEGLQLAGIATKNVGESDRNPRMNYIMVMFD